MADARVGIVDAVPPTSYVDNEDEGTFGGIPVKRQRVASFEKTGLVPVEFDEIDLTYNVDGSVATAIYKKASVTVATLTLGYTSGNLTSVVRS
jgi:hypothetical protein